MRRDQENILFVFLSFQHRESTNRVAVLHSLIFQLLYTHRHLRPALQKAFDCDYRDLQSFADYNQQLLTDLLQCIGVTYIVLDGLDEISEKERHILLNGFLQMSNLCPELKVMVSSREEIDISGLLRSRALSLRIGLRNSKDIELYFNTRVEEWLNTLEIDDATYSSLTSLLQGVPERAKGIAGYRLYRAFAEGIRDVPLCEACYRKSEKSTRSSRYKKRSCKPSYGIRPSVSRFDTVCEGRLSLSVTVVLSRESRICSPVKSLTPGRYLHGYLARGFHYANKRSSRLS